MKKFLLSCVAGAALLSTSAFADDAKLLDVPHIAVAGQCFVKVTPDRGSITVTSEFRNPTDAKAVSKQATDTYEAALATIKKLNLKDAEYQTTGYTLTEIREWVNNQSVFKGYMATVGVSVTTSETARLGDVIAAATNAGLKNVGGLYTYASQPKLNEAYSSCYEQAVTDAKQKAQKMLAPVGAKLGRVLTINSTEMPPVQPMMYAERGMMMKSMAADAAVPAPTVESKDQELRLSVNAIFEIQ